MAVKRSDLRIQVGLRGIAFRFYGSLRAVKVVQTTASTLTVLAAPGRASKASRWSNVTPESTTLTVSPSWKNRQVCRIRLKTLPTTASHLS
jgi:hypothetical protein